ncbi:MAG: hypothetical protein WCX95_04950 [Candidatus Gracilibacteria bacterium]
MGLSGDVEGQLEVFDPDKFTEELRRISVEFFRTLTLEKMQSLTPEEQQRIPFTRIGTIGGIEHSDNPTCPGCIDTVVETMKRFPDRVEEIRATVDAFLTKTTGSDAIKDRRYLDRNGPGANFLFNTEVAKRIFWSRVAVRLVQKLLG